VQRRNLLSINVSPYYSRQVRRSKLTWSGIALIVIGITVFGERSIWLLTRINVPIDMPISMAVGRTTTPRFKVNANQFYWIKIVAKKTIPFDTLNCLLGTSSSVAKPCVEHQVIEANWILRSNGVPVAHGSSEVESGGSWSRDEISRMIGSIQAQRNRDYVLDVDILADGRALAITDPHLKIEVSGFTYEDYAFGTVFIMLICAALALLGAILIGASAVRSRRKRNRAHSA
jgi:hypothetical protein